MNFSLTAIFSLIFCAPASAVILYGKDNSANKVDPGGGLPWDSVARLSNSAGSVIGGSGVYLGNGYILTANHVGPFASVTFDGTTFYDHDGITPTQILSTDMKIFRLTSLPDVAAVSLYGGSSELGNMGTLVGWGVGRDPSDPINSSVVTWGDNSTIDKRFGLNQPTAAINAFSYASYTFDALETSLGSSTGFPAGTGVNEAAATLIDSGSGLFQEIGGTWYLTGLTSTVTSQNGYPTSTFGKDLPGVITPGSPTGIVIPPGGGDTNYFVRIGSYQSQINSFIPEPSSLLLLLTSSLFLLRRRR